MLEYPSPSARLQTLRGPAAGHVDASGAEDAMKSRCGPPHNNQSPGEPLTGARFCSPRPACFGTATTGVAQTSSAQLRVPASTSPLTSGTLECVVFRSSCITLDLHLCPLTLGAPINGARPRAVKPLLDWCFIYIGSMKVSVAQARPIPISTTKPSTLCCSQNASVTR